MDITAKNKGLYATIFLISFFNKNKSTNIFRSFFFINAYIIYYYKLIKIKIMSLVNLYKNGVTLIIIEHNSNCKKNYFYRRYNNNHTEVVNLYIFYYVVKVTLIILIHVLFVIFFYIYIT